MAINIRGKGQRGERESIVLLQAWAGPVMQARGLPPLELTRNLVQSRSGGYDILGLDWLALEVKRHENLAVPQWWRQTVKQTGPGQIPFLMYRQNRTRWKFRTQLFAAHYSPCGHSSVSQLIVDMEEDQARSWFQNELHTRLVNLHVDQSSA
jgi:hypothetical protein